MFDHPWISDPLAPRLEVGWKVTFVPDVHLVHCTIGPRWR